MRDELRFAPEELERTAALIRVLDSTMRLRILLLLHDSQRAVHELVGLLGKSQPLVSQHLRVLRDEGLVAAKRCGREVTYELAHPAVVRMIHTLVGHARALYAPAPGPTLAAAAIVDPPAGALPDADPGLAPRTPLPNHD